MDNELPAAEILTTDEPNALDVQKVVMDAVAETVYEQRGYNRGSDTLIAAIGERVRARLTEPDAGEGTERSERLWDEMYPKSGPAMRRATPDTTEATLRAALEDWIGSPPTHNLDAADERLIEAANEWLAALQQPAIQPEGGTE